MNSFVTHVISSIIDIISSYVFKIYIIQGFFLYYYYKFTLLEKMDQINGNLFKITSFAWFFKASLKFLGNLSRTSEAALFILVSLKTYQKKNN